MIEFMLKEDADLTVTVDEAVKHKQLIDQINYLIDEGFIQAEEGEDGQVRLYPT